MGNIKSFDTTRQKSFNIKVNWDIDLKSPVIYLVPVILVLLHLCVTIAMIYFSHEILILCVIATEFFILLVTKNTNRLMTKECVRLNKETQTLYEDFGKDILSSMRDSLMIHLENYQKFGCLSVYSLEQARTHAKIIARMVRTYKHMPFPLSIVLYTLAIPGAFYTECISCEMPGRAYLTLSDLIQKRQ